MNNIRSYTPLESLLLFQSLLSHGIGDADFLRTSDLLKNNPLIKEGATYDARRLSPESLQELFLQLLREELDNEADTPDRPDSGLSPNSKKRKLQPPPVPTLKDARDHISRVPILADRLYARYRDHIVREIREDEERFDVLQGEIRDIERRGLEENQSGAVRPGDKPETQARPAAAEVPANGGAPDQRLPNGDSRAHPSTPQPQVAAGPEKPGATAPPPLAAPRPTAPSLDQQGQAVPNLGGRTPEPSKPPSGTAQVLQPPQGVSSLPPRQVPSPQPAAEGLQRPEGIARPKASPVPQTLQPQHPGQLKWEPPYQPMPAAAQTRPTPPLGQYPHQPPQGVPLAKWNPQAQQPYPSPRAPPSGTHHPQAVPQPASASAQGVEHHPQLQPAPGGRPSEPTAARPQAISPSPAPVPGHGQPGQPPHPTGPQPSTNRPLAAASPATPAAASAHGPVPSQTRRQQPPSAHAPPPHAQPVSPSPTTQGAYSSPYHLPPRPAIPDHILQQQQMEQRLATATPTPPARASSFAQPPQPPQTPVSVSGLYHALGSGTKWRTSSTPSTPHPEMGDMEAPAYEPLSPVLAHSALPTASPELRQRKLAHKPAKEGDISIAKPRGRSTRTRGGVDVPTTPVPPPLPRGSQRASSPTEESNHPSSAPGSATIKNEETTPRPATEAGDTTADESVPGRRRASRLAKRKRRDSTPPNREPPPPPSHVLWTRSFNKVSHSAMEQIISHRSANMFASQIRERDAPGYNSIILQPQDLKSIRAAMNRGNRAAAAAALALPDGDPGTSSVWLPISEELVPPKGIINSAQLDRELAHMFSNAIMYNPDPNRGPGPRFMREVEDEDEEGADPADGALGYKVDENGVVNDTRAMFVEVQKLLSDLQSAEIQRGAPPVPATGTNTRQASVAGGFADTPDRKDELGSAAEEVEEHAATEPENQTAKRRRITRG